MTFIHTVLEKDAEGAVAEMYDTERGADGALPNYARPFSLRPELMGHWEALLVAVRETMPSRRYELATLGAAQAMSHSYCMLAHGSVLLSGELSEDDLHAIVTGQEGNPLSDQERAIMDYAGKIATDAAAITRNDVDALKSHGLSDQEIFDIASVVAVRCFFSKLLDAVGTQPDSHFSSVANPLQDALTPGRAIDT